MTVKLYDPAQDKEVELSDRDASAVILVFQAELGSQGMIENEEDLLSVKEALMLAWDIEGYGEHCRAYARPSPEFPHDFQGQGEDGNWSDCRLCGEESQHYLHLKFNEV